jgi:hypothetical protein
MRPLVSDTLKVLERVTNAVISYALLASHTVTEFMPVFTRSDYDVKGVW